MRTRRLKHVRGPGHASWVISAQNRKHKSRGRTDVLESTEDMRWDGDGISRLKVNVTVLAVFTGLEAP